MIPAICYLISACSPFRRIAPVPLSRSQETGSRDLELANFHSRSSSSLRLPASKTVSLQQPHGGIRPNVEDMQRIIPTTMLTPHRPNITRLPMTGISFVLVLTLMRTERRRPAHLDVNESTWTFSSPMGGSIVVKFLSVMGTCHACHVLKVLDISTARTGYCMVESTVVESSLLDWRGAVDDPEVSVPDGPYEYVSHYSPHAVQDGVYHVFPTSRLSRRAHPR